ncbi:MAG: TonB-dependent receptor [Pseudomonadales bacterium]|nr:TonB-dependent receptor [Pseudomonadales bacterium]MBO6597308.1 TonB-dependent receptor [Pseudomonadales bacterium]MBO6824510.1 TonB-dependent receptor [Pseudomonadales bacterium]
MSFARILSRKLNLRTLSTALLATGATFSQVVLSQGVVEEIVVTARMQEESMQDVPVAVTSIGEDVMETFRIDEATDLISRVPALNISVGGSGAGAQITLRGVGSSFISNAFDSAVALNYDGISMSTQRLVQAAFFDVEQVDVLKGPQSLYFGKAASAGVLSLRSANPTDEWEYGFKTSREFEEDGTTFGGYISGPINETLGIRFAAEYQDVDEWVEIAAGNPTVQPERGLENFISRVTFHWEPSERLTANLKINYNSQNSDALNSHLDMFCGADGPDPSVLLGGAFGGIPGFDLFLPTHDCDIDDGKFIGPDAHPLIDTAPAGGPGSSRNIFVAYNDTDTLFARLQVDYDLSETLGLTFLAGYVDLENEYNDTFNSTGQLPDGTPAGLSAPFENTLEQYTAEVRLISNYDGPFNFQIGGFWETREIGHLAVQNAFNPTLFAALGPPFGPDLFTGYTFDWLADRPIDADAVSVFVSGQYEFNDHWELSGGVRWTDEEKSTSNAFPYIHFGVTALGLSAVPSGYQGGDVDFEDDNISPELVLTYRMNDDISIYAAYKSGFKSGGLDNNTLPTGTFVLDLDSPDPDTRNAAISLLTFESEESDGGEIGFRSQLLDQSLLLNLTAYRYVYENQQVQLFNPAVFAFDTTNAGEFITEGLDIDFVWITKVPGLSVSGAWGFLDTEITGDLETIGGDNLKGRKGGLAPDLSGNIAVNWETTITDNLILAASANFAYKDEYIVGAEPFEFDPISNPTGYLLQDSYTTVDLNISLMTPDQKWRLSLIGVNLTDEQYLTFAGPAPFRPATGDDQLVGVTRGKQVFVEFAMNF